MDGGEDGDFGGVVEFAVCAEGDDAEVSGVGFAEAVEDDGVAWAGGCAVGVWESAVGEDLEGDGPAVGDAVDDEVVFGEEEFGSLGAGEAYGGFEVGGAVGGSDGADGLFELPFVAGELLDDGGFAVEGDDHGEVAGVAVDETGLAEALDEAGGGFFGGVEAGGGRGAVAGVEGGHAGGAVDEDDVALADE